MTEKYYVGDIIRLDPEAKANYSKYFREGIPEEIWNREIARAITLTSKNFSVERYVTPDHWVFTTRGFILVKRPKLKHLTAGTYYDSAQRKQIELTKAHCKMLNEFGEVLFEGKVFPLLRQDILLIDEIEHRIQDINPKPGMIYVISERFQMDGVYEIGPREQFSDDQLKQYRFYTNPEFYKIVDSGIKLFDNKKDVHIYLYPPTKMKVMHRNEVRKLEEFSIMFPWFVVGCAKDNMYLFFFQTKPTVTSVFRERVRWAPLPNIFSDGKMCIQLPIEGKKNRKIALYQLYESIWDSREITPINKPEDFPFCANGSALLKYWATLDTEEKIEKIKWKMLEGVYTLDQFMRIA